MMMNFRLIVHCCACLLIMSGGRLAAGDGATTDAPDTASPDEYAKVVELLLEWQLSDDEDWGRSLDARTLVLLEAFIVGELVRFDHRADRLSEDQRTELLTQLWSSGDEADRARVDELASAIIATLSDHVRGEARVSEAVALNVGTVYDVAFSFQDEEAQDDACEELAELIAISKNPRMRRRLFDHLIRFSHRRERTARAYLYDRQRDIAYICARILAQEQDPEALPVYVHYAWDLFENREARPSVLLGFYSPPFDALEKVIEGAPKLYSREAQIEWLRNEDLLP